MILLHILIEKLSLLTDVLSVIAHFMLDLRPHGRFLFLLINLPDNIKNNESDILLHCIYRIYNRILPTKMCIKFASYLHKKSANRVLNMVLFMLWC